MSFQPRYIVIHHSATAENASLEDIKLVHLLRGFDDIGYHWLVYNDGSIRSARPENKEGAHALGFNSESLGVCLVGNYEHNTPSQSCLDSLVNLLQVLCGVYSITTDRIITHQAVDKKLATGRLTACPGQALIEALPKVITDVNCRLIYFAVFQEDYRSIFILEPIHVSSLVVISGRLYNVGRKSWDCNPASDSYPFRIGLKVFNSRDKLIWEGRELITDLIDKGQYFDFMSIIPRANLESGINRIVLSVVNEGRFWFNEIGDSAYAVSIDTSENNLSFSNASTTATSKYSQRFMDLELNQHSENEVEFKGNLVNSGSIFWDNTIKNNSNVGSYELLMKIISTSNLSCIYEELLSLPRIFIEPGSQLPFASRLAIDRIPKGKYLIHLDVVKHSKFRFSDLGHSTVLVGLLSNTSTANQIETLVPNRPSEVINPKLGFSAALINFSVTLRYGFVLGVRGQLENSGAKSWNNVSDLSDKPTRLGIKIFSLHKERKLVWESRYNLPHKYIQVKEVLPIDTDFNLFGLPAGTYEVVLDVVKERCFWFSDDPTLGLFKTSIVISEQVGTRSLISGINYVPKTIASDVKVLVVAPILPLFDRETGGKRLLAILKILREQGFEVQYTYEEPGLVVDVERYKKAVEDLGILLRPNPTGTIVDLLPDTIDVVLLCWHECANRHIDLVRLSQPKAKVIVDTVDLHWVRERRGVKAGELKFTEAELKQRKSAEINVYRKADVVWVVTEDDRQALHEEIPDCRSVVVSNMSEKFAHFSESMTSDGLLFLGGFNHPPNEQAALRAFQAIEKYRKSTGNKVKYYIVGSNPTKEIQDIHDGEYNMVCGYVENLDKYFKTCRALIAPITYGAGIKGKVCDAICAGLTVITSKLGNEGLNLVDRQEVFLAESIDDYVLAIKDVFSENFNLAEINEKALDKVLKITGYEAARKPVTYSIIVPPVALAIVTYNKLGLLDKLLDSLFCLTTHPDFVVSVWLNGCNDGSIELCEEFLRLFPKQFEFHCNQDNEFFVRPNNKIIEKYGDRDIVLVNNDIEIISKDWLLELQQAAYTSDFVGAAGGKILDEHGKISEAGAIIYDTGMGENIGRGALGDAKEFDLVRYVGFVSGCLMYMRRDMINKYGALDDDFHPMYYEDCDWQYRLHLHGVRTIYTPRAKVIHREGSSAGTDTSQGMKKYQEINRAKFLSKFSGQSIMGLNKV